MLATSVNNNKNHNHKNSLVAKASSTQTEWDLSSSITGTVKRRPSSLDSCKSNSPITPSPTSSSSSAIVDNIDSVDFPIEKKKNSRYDNGNSKDIVSATSCKINKHQDVDLCKEIEDGNVGVLNEKKKKKKIDSPSIKKRILKLPESARKSFSSKLKLPNSLALNNTNNNGNNSKKGNKLSLSQLEQKNNLFIRDGNSSSGEEKVSSSSKKTITTNVMEKIESANPKQQQQQPKKSLIPSFLSSNGGSSKNLNQIKNSSTKTNQNFVAKTGNRFKELYPLRNKKQNPPPYRPPPLPPSRTKNNRQSRNIDDEDNDRVTSTTISTQAIVHVPNENENIDADEVDIMAVQPEYNANVFKNIPVRQRKGNVPHMENYCLFDPTTDFCNEKDLTKKIPQMEIKAIQFNVENEEKIEDVTFDDQTLYDITEHDERVAHHNYYEIDPELLEQEEKTTYKNQLSSSSDSSNSSANASTSETTSSSDYPSLFNSVIETTHSSNVESTTDDNDSNGYGKVAAVNKSNDEATTCASNESIVTVVVDSTTTSTGTTKKKSPQVDRIIRPQLKKPSIVGVKLKSKAMQLDSLKQSHSLPHLHPNGSARSRHNGNNSCNNNKNNNNEFNFNNIDNAIQMRRNTQGRPLSTHSDDRDSGFLSPATPPDCQNINNNSGGNVVGENKRERTKTESTLLNQCDNIQQLIEVSELDYNERLNEKKLSKTNAK
jgi:hypothetical protein